MSGFSHAVLELSKMDLDQVPLWSYLTNQMGFQKVISEDELNLRFGSMSQEQAMAIRQEIRDRLVARYAQEIIL